MEEDEKTRVKRKKEESDQRTHEFGAGTSGDEPKFSLR